MQNQIESMLELQEAMNAKVHPQWRTQGFEWYRAIWVECAELMEHYGWKWWKKQSADMEQVKLELIDIWHFGLSQLIESGIDAELIAIDFQSQYHVQSNLEFKKSVEAFASHTLSEQEFSVPLFARMLIAIDMSFTDLYTGYIGKNVLNFFRQDHGYKEGTYKKIWNGKEDNEHLVIILDRLDASASDFNDQLYNALKAEYNALSNESTAVSS